MMTFDDAQQNCKSKGGDLVSLHSTYEQAFLTSVVKDQAVWIGMRLNPVSYFNNNNTTKYFEVV